MDFNINVFIQNGKSLSQKILSSLPLDSSLLDHLKAKHIVLKGGYWNLKQVMFPPRPLLTQPDLLLSLPKAGTQLDFLFPGPWL